MLFSVRHLVLDEADRMLDNEFLSQIQEIVAACSHEKVQKAVFSATLPAGAEKLAMDMLKDPIRIVVGLKCVDVPPSYGHIHSNLTNTHHTETLPCL
jgi:ATP-dependent RNA helicase DDX52/ROK1